MLNQEAAGAISDRQIAGIRFYLSLCGLLAVFLDASKFDHLVPLTYAVFINALYSALIYAATPRVDGFSRWRVSLMVWTDIVLFSILISLSSGTNSVFFFFYFFAIIEACSRLSANEGI